ncbi:DUF885 family protein [[Mycoplasma] falconis]|uniref:DUF885 family protein n=1 Tax=[Mycoplasma] falconis TaxID=92403 RepID=A0A501XAF2_9BACT|nr:DUF885 family protein [[Mycoplasma] falconis]TPE57555.1 DUF885 family protein [[Mycoplasma] falconis]
MKTKINKKAAIFLTGAATFVGALSLGLGIGFGITAIQEPKTPEMFKAEEAIEASKQAESNLQTAETALNKLESDLKELNNKTEKTDEDQAKITELTALIASKKEELKTLEKTAKDALEAKLVSEEAVVSSPEGNTQSRYNITADYILSVYKKYKSQLQDYIYKLSPTVEEEQKIEAIINEGTEKLNKIVKENLITTSLAWNEGIKYDWEIIKGNYTSGVKNLIPSFNWGPNYPYPANSFYESIAVDNKEQAIEWLATIKKASQELNFVPSKIFIKNNLRFVLQNLYEDKLLKFIQSNDETITVAKLIGFDTTKPQESWTDQDAIDAFYTEYATNYYAKSTYGFGQNEEVLTLYKTPKAEGDAAKELENTIEVKGPSGKKDEKGNAILKIFEVYGLGLTAADLNQRNIGIGYVPGNEIINGKTVYNQLLKLNTTSNYTAQQVYDKGYSETKKAAANMKAIAAKVAELIAGPTGAWNPTVRYDGDGVGPNPAENVVLNIRNENGEINLSEFNKWLTQEEFFFGREDASYYTPEVKQSLTTAPDLTFAVEDLKAKGYDVLLSEAVKDKKYGSITNEQFYYGALEAFKNYVQFRAKTFEYGESFFPKDVPVYEMETYPYSKRDSSGVGSYNGSVMKFQFNSDPYYGLPKWSLTSFANHETVMGHHNQIQYAAKYLAKINEENLGNVFDYTAYVEGWALFMEWFAIESGWYGSPDYNSNDYYSMPVDFLNGKGITSFFKARQVADVTESEIQQIKELHTGSYWKEVASVKNYEDDKEHALAAVQLANMLNYFGALNEAQLRNMRLAIDTIYHSPEVVGQEDLPTGASINQAREFMKNNSALGIGDITSESKRYFNLPGQAVSYNSGKAKMLDLYDAVRNKLGLSREEFVNQSIKGVEKANIKKLLNLYLENGALPLEALAKVVALEYDLKN